MDRYMYMYFTVQLCTVYIVTCIQVDAMYMYMDRYMYMYIVLYCTVTCVCTVYIVTCLQVDAMYMYMDR